ncbi:hypothetical protein Btru_000350 [Bulinus truncatus]|nr:hypothetical protein Btru_000350 [Bulinus truncatus]
MTLSTPGSSSDRYFSLFIDKGSNDVLTINYKLCESVSHSWHHLFTLTFVSHFTLVSKMLDIELMSRYVSPINPAVFPHLTVVLLGIGIFFMAWFFVYEVTSTKFARDLKKELVVSLVASIFMGFGVLFLLLWVGIYV